MEETMQDYLNVEEKSRIEKIRDYLFDVINSLTENRNYQINADWLGNVGDFSLDKIPTETETIKWITGNSIKRDVFSFRSRKSYSADELNNLDNIGFFEDFEAKIKSNNDKGILPNIPRIESIKCLSCGTLIGVDGTRATFDIQIETRYREE